MRKFTLFLVSSILLISNSCATSSSRKSDLHRHIIFPACEVCKIFVDSFKKGIDKTSKGKFEGGDAAWEEENLGSYAKSEIRLVEIQEKVCLDVEEGRDHCYSLHEQYDSEIEDWWFNHQIMEPDLYKYLCIDIAKLCCPDSHFGLDCTPCPGYPDTVCNNNGKCDGSGTRKGNGSCICASGYTGSHCDSCAETYFEAYKDDVKLLCSKCPSSCDGPCTKSRCEKCANGWIRDKNEDCLDINECTGTKAVCSSQQFCVNTDGSYRCLDCDKSCSECTGDGPDMCINCADGYTLKDKICVDYVQEKRKQHMFLTRYLTYLGLCVATCIILQRNMALAAIIGLTVAFYISLSEYMLNTTPAPNTTNFVDKLLLQEN